MAVVVRGQDERAVGSTFQDPCHLLGGIQSRRPLHVGAYTYSYSLIGPFVWSIGRYCSIASGVKFGEMEHATTWLTSSNVTYDPAFWEADRLPMRLPAEAKRQGVQIGNDVWIGANAYIRGGVVIGDGAIIGTHAVVTKDVAPFSIMAGNPAKLIRYRFSDDVMARISARPWWVHDLDDLPSDLSDLGAALDSIEALAPFDDAAEVARRCRTLVVDVPPIAVETGPEDSVELQERALENLHEKVRNMLLTGVKFLGAEGWHDDDWCSPRTRIDIRVLVAGDEIVARVWLKPEEAGPARTIFTLGSDTMTSKAEFVSLGDLQDLVFPGPFDAGDELSLRLSTPHRASRGADERDLSFMLQSLTIRRSMAE